MIATQITYRKLHNLGNYNHEVYEITLLVEEGEKAQDVMDKAKEFVNKQIEKPKEFKVNLNGMELTKEQAVKALDLIESIDEHACKDDLPF